MKLLYFDCFSGISGDMAISSLLCHGVDIDVFKEKLKGIALNNYSVAIGDAQKNGISAKTFKVEFSEEHHHHRNINDIREIINKSDLSDNVKNISIEIFQNLAEAEGKVHGKPAEEVHFHEVGAVDSIVDIIGVSILIDMIKPDKVMCSPLPISSGFIRSQHGLMPVPAPATAELLKKVPIYDSGIKGELVTPTGAAIIKTLADEFGGIPEMKVNSIGYGAGMKDFDIPNVLRTYIGTVDVKKKQKI